MTEHDGSQLAEADAALLRRLPARAHLIARRLRGFHAGGWDINGLCLLQVEAAELGAGSQALGLAEREELPGLETGDELLALAEALAEAVPEPLPEPELVEIEFEAI